MAQPHWRAASEPHIAFSLGFFFLESEYWWLLQIAFHCADGRKTHIDALTRMGHGDTGWINWKAACRARSRCPARQRQRQYSNVRVLI